MAKWRKVGKEPKSNVDKVVKGKGSKKADREKDQKRRGRRRKVADKKGGREGYPNEWRRQGGELGGKGCFFYLFLCDTVETRIQPVARIEAANPTEVVCYRPGSGPGLRLATH